MAHFGWGGGHFLFMGNIVIGELNNNDGQKTGVWLGLKPVSACYVFRGLHSMYYDAENKLRAEGAFTGKAGMNECFKFQKTKTSNPGKALWIKTDLEPHDLVWHNVPIGRYTPLWNCQIQTALIGLTSTGSIGIVAFVAAFISTFWAMFLLTIAWLMSAFGQSAIHTATFVITPLKLWNLDFTNLEALSINYLANTVPFWRF